MLGFEWLIHETASSGYYWYFTLIPLDAFYCFIKLCPTSSPFIGLYLPSGGEPSGYRSSFALTCRLWEFRISIPIPSGPRPMAEGWGWRNSQLSGLWGGISTTEVSSRIRMKLPSTGVHLTSPSWTASPFFFSTRFSWKYFFHKSLVSESSSQDPLQRTPA